MNVIPRIAGTKILRNIPCPSYELSLCNREERITRERLSPPNIQRLHPLCRRSRDCVWSNAVRGPFARPPVFLRRAHQTPFASDRNINGNVQRLLRERKETPSVCFDSQHPFLRCPR